MQMFLFQILGRLCQCTMHIGAKMNVMTNMTLFCVVEAVLFHSKWKVIFLINYTFLLIDEIC